MVRKLEVFQESKTRQVIVATYTNQKLQVQTQISLNTEENTSLIVLIGGYT